MLAIVRCSSRRRPPRPAASSIPRRRAVRGGHADRQPGRPELRALHVLALVDAVACEDTRHSAAPAASTSACDKPLLALHEHNERDAAGAVLARLARGERVAYVSDAGTPAVSDPGAALVAAVRGAGYRVRADAGRQQRAGRAEGGRRRRAASGFVFVGFLPAHGARARAGAGAMRAQRRRPRCCSRRRTASRRWPTRSARPARSARVTVCRELTKQFETVVTLPAPGPAGLAGGRRRTARAANSCWCCTRRRRGTRTAGEAEHDALLALLLAASCR